MTAALCLCCWTPKKLQAQPQPEATTAIIPLQCTQKGPRLRCEIKISAAFGPDLRLKLRTGLLNRFLYRIYIRRIEDDEPVSLSALQQLQVYELWDEVHYIFDRRDSVKKTTGNIKTALETLGNIEGSILTSDLPPGRYYADLIVELNPLTGEDEAAIRSWIARNRGGHRTFTSGGRSFFGTFVSLFVNIRPGNAEWSHRVHSRPFSIIAISPITPAEDPP